MPRKRHVTMASYHVPNIFYNIGSKAHQAGVMEFWHSSTGINDALGTDEKKTRPRNEQKKSHYRTQPHQIAGVSSNENHCNGNMNNESSIHHSSFTKVKVAVSY